MTPALAQFSDWVLALLPRLFIYPGGFWLVCAVAGWRLLRRGLPTLRAPSQPAAFSFEQNVSLALAWVVLALLPMPGAAPLPFPADRFTLTALLAVSALLGRASAIQARMLPVQTLASMAPLALGAGLLDKAGMWELSGWLAALSVMAALLALTGSRALNAGRDVQVLAWIGLGAAPIWSLTQPLPGVLFTSLVYAAMLVILAVAERWGLARRYQAALVAIALAMAALSLLAALLRVGL